MVESLILVMRDFPYDKTLQIAPEGIHKPLIFLFTLL